MVGLLLTKSRAYFSSIRRLNLVWEIVTESNEVWSRERIHPRRFNGVWVGTDTEEERICARPVRKNTAQRSQLYLSGLERRDTDGRSI